MKRDSISMTRLPICPEFLGPLEEVKGSLWRDFGGTSEAQRHLLRLTLNEAEALAWQTPFPDLLFPLLAEEKARALEQWTTHQRAVQRTRASSAARLL
jgi:hypothetical protein